MKATQVVASVVVATTALFLVAAGCGNDAGKPDESLPSPETSTPAPPATSTPTPPATNTPASSDKPVVNIQFIGGADLSDESKSSLADVVESIQASVVQIVAGGGSGSGFIVDAGGLVITNEHVVAGERSVGVLLTNGCRYDGDVLERDATADLALVQIDGTGPFDAIAIGDPDGVRMGDEVLALGFPLADRIGINLTVTRGIISSTRTVSGVELLQTDAAVNPGNSGGPLVNRDGEVIGVNTSKIEETDSGRPVDNIGFAVSVSELERRLPTLGGRRPANPGTPTPMPAPMPTPEPTWIPAPTFTPEPTWTPAPTFTPEPTSTPTLTPTPTITPTPTSTPTPTPTRTPTPTPTPTPTSTPTPTPTPIPPFVAVSSGGGDDMGGSYRFGFTCGLRADGTVVCRGSNGSRESTPPKDERLTSISSGVAHTCGLRSDGSVLCWGRYGQYTPPEGERFVSISSGLEHNCGVRADGVAICWGKEQRGSPPDYERFISISSGRYHACGLRDDGYIACWGSNTYGQSSPPRDGGFISVSSGDDHTCGLRDDGVAACWGDYNAPKPPEDERFTSISSGDGFTCGLRDDGSVVCWGRDLSGQSSPPEDERFTSISSGGGHACGLREDGVIVCWGDNEFGQSSPPLR